MSAKSVFHIERKEILKRNPAFEEKKLCDGYTMTAGDACRFTCGYCSTGPMFEVFGEPVMKNLRESKGLEHGQMQVRRKNPEPILFSQLFDSRGRTRFVGPNYHGKVVYCSPTVDCAADIELADETTRLSRLLLKYTSFHVRLLSKSNLLPRIAGALEDIQGARQRMIFGCSTGTLDDRLAAAFEKGTAKVSKRLESIRRLADDGWRTFGMVCPVLPEADFSTLRDLLPPSVEEIWGEAINLRGKSFADTINDLLAAGYGDEANRVSLVCGPRSRERWEQYCRDSFEQLADIIPDGRLRWLQYVRNTTAAWWHSQSGRGALVLGKASGQ